MKWDNMLTLVSPLTLCLAGLLVACALTPPANAKGAPAAKRGAPDKDLVAVADAILRFQMPDGAITMGPPAAPGSGADGSAAKHHLIPYFANFAAQGLTDAFHRTGDVRYRDAARRWVAWYEAHMNPDGTVYDYDGAPGAWKGTGDYDSTDSYAGTYLELVRDLHRAAPDAAWLRARKPFLPRAAAAIRLTLQPSGLTLAKPKWPVMYTMDNTETARGLRAGAELAKALEETDQAKTLSAEARRMEEAIDQDLWDSSRDAYRIGVQPDGGKMEGLSAWYPDIMANLMAVGWRPASARNKALFVRLRTQFEKGIPAEIRNEDELGVVVWWAIAARGAGDKPFARTLIGRIRDAREIMPAVNDPGTLGHVARLLAAS